MHNLNLQLAVLGCLLDFGAIVVFWPFSSTTQLNLLFTSAVPNGYASTTYANMHGVFLHASADLLTHVGLLGATWLERAQVSSTPCPPVSSSSTDADGSVPWLAGSGRTYGFPTV